MIRLLLLTVGLGSIQIHRGEKKSNCTLSSFVIHDTSDTENIMWITLIDVWFPSWKGEQE